MTPALTRTLAGITARGLANDQLEAFALLRACRAARERRVAPLVTLSRPAFRRIPAARRAALAAIATRLLAR